MIKVENVHLPHVEKTVSFTIPKKLNLLLGENGAGKTLFLDMLSGLTKIKKGEIIGNQSIIYINQNIYFSDRLKGIDFLKFCYGLNGSSSIESFFSFSDTFISRTELNNYLEKQWGLLSGGERRIIYILILLSIDREWYILDEPFASLDADRRQILYDMIQFKLNEHKGIILTTHEEHNSLMEKDINILRI